MTPQQLTALRQQLALSPHQFAELTGVSLRTARAWERGEARPTRSALILLYYLKRNPEDVIHIRAAVADVGRQGLSESGEPL